MKLYKMTVKTGILSQSDYWVVAPSSSEAEELVHQHHKECDYFRVESVNSEQIATLGRYGKPETLLIFPSKEI